MARPFREACKKFATIQQVAYNSVGRVVARRGTRSYLVTCP